MVDFLGGCLGGCFSSRMSRTVCVLVGSLVLAMLFRGRGPLPFACVTSRRAAHTLPSIMSLAKSLVVQSSSFFCDC